MARFTDFFPSLSNEGTDRLVGTYEVPQTTGGLTVVVTRTDGNLPSSIIVGASVTLVQGATTAEGSVTATTDTTFTVMFLAATTFAAGAVTVDLETSVFTNVIEANGGINTTNLNLDPGTTDADALLGTDVDDNVVGVALSTAFSLTPGAAATDPSVLGIANLAINNTLAASSATAQTGAAALTAYIASWAGTATGGFSVVAAGTAISQGDLLLLSHPDGTPPAPQTESYIYTGPDVTAPAALTASNFADITHTGDVVESVTGGTNITAAGTPTVPVLNLDATLVDITSVASAANAPLTLTSTGELRFVGTGIDTAATDAAPLNVIIGSDGHLMTGDAETVALNVVRATATGVEVPGGSLAILRPVAANSILQIPAAPTVGTCIRISNLSAGMAGIWQLRGATNIGSTATTVAAGTIIMGRQVAADAQFNLDDATASFEIVYAGGAEGWVIIGAN